MKLDIQELVSRLLPVAPAILYFDSPVFGHKRAIRDIYEWFLNDQINVEICGINWADVVAFPISDAIIRELKLSEFIAKHGFYRNVTSVLYSADKRRGTQTIDSSAIVIGTAQLNENTLYFVMSYDSNRCETCGLDHAGRSILLHGFVYRFL